jgi:transcriptional regulator with XRE-family HTH domain
VAKNLTSVDKSIGIKLRDKRISMGLSQEQLAKKLLIDSRDVNLYETGAKRFAAHLLLRLAVALDVSPVYFFGITDDIGRSPEMEERPRENVSLLTLPDQGLRLNRAFASIRNPDVREVIVGLVEKIATTYEAR